VGDPRDERANQLREEVAGATSPRRARRRSARPRAAFFGPPRLMCSTLRLQRDTQPVFVAIAERQERGDQPKHKKKRVTMSRIAVGTAPIEVLQAPAARPRQLTSNQTTWRFRELTRSRRFRFAGRDSAPKGFCLCWDPRQELTTTSSRRMEASCCVAVLATALPLVACLEQQKPLLQLLKLDN
jgi:hypothetical protein